MKKILANLCLLACLFGVVGFAACNKEDADTKESFSTSTESESGALGGEDDVEITGVTFASAEYVYDGEEKTLTATGIPDGVVASYTGNKGRNAGVYSATVTLSGDGYITKTLTATLTIKKADIAGVSLEQDGEVKYDGTRFFPALNGTLPTGAQTKWEFNGVEMEDGVKDPDEYEVKLVISCPNYNDLTLNATFTITPDYTKMAANVIDSFGEKPEPWSYLPESFAMENRTVSSALAGKTTEQTDPYADFVSVGTLPSNYIGKQMNVIYGVLNTATTALGYVSTVHSALNVIETAYQTFLNDNPANYKLFEGTTGAFSYKIELDESYYTLTASISGIEVRIFGDIENGTYGARIQLGEKNVLKYEVSPSSLTIAWTVLEVHSTEIILLKNADDTVEGYIYEYTVALGDSSTYLHVDNDYTTVVGTKGDFIPTSDSRNCEVYDNATGRFVGAEVRETVEFLGKTYTYDTLWYDIKDVAGITSIKREKGKQSGSNADTIYINGSTEKLHSKNVSLVNASRRFDIEFKEVCAYTYDAAEEKYEQVTVVIPMVFIQESHVGSFEEDFSSENKMDGDGAKIAVDLTVETSDSTAVNQGYYVLVEIYDTIKNLVSQDMIIAFCAKKV